MVESHAANFSGDADAKAPSPQPSPRGRGSSPWRRARFRNSYPCSSPRPLLREPPGSSPSPSGGGPGRGPAESPDSLANSLSRERERAGVRAAGGASCVYLHGMVESRAANFSGDADAKAPSPQPSPRGRGSRPWRRARFRINSFPSSSARTLLCEPPDSSPSPSGGGPGRGPAESPDCLANSLSRERERAGVRAAGGASCVYLHGMVESHAANFSGDADAKAPSPQPSPRGRGSRPWRRARFRQFVPCSRGSGSRPWRRGPILSRVSRGPP